MTVREVYRDVQNIWKGPMQAKWGFGQHQHKSLSFCDDFALTRDNTNYASILLNKKLFNTRAIYESSLNCVLIGLCSNLN